MEAREKPTGENGLSQGQEFSFAVKAGKIGFKVDEEEGKCVRWNGKEC